jgi:hypothetical protein
MAKWEYRSDIVDFESRADFVAKLQTIGNLNWELFEVKIKLQGDAIGDSAGQAYCLWKRFVP